MSTKVRLEGRVYTTDMFKDQAELDEYVELLGLEQALADLMNEQAQRALGVGVVEERAVSRKAKKPKKEEPAVEPKIAEPAVVIAPNGNGNHKEEPMTAPTNSNGTVNVFDLAELRLAPQGEETPTAEFEDVTRGFDRGNPNYNPGHFEAWDVEQVVTTPQPDCPQIVFGPARPDVEKLLVVSGSFQASTVGRALALWEPEQGTWNLSQVYDPRTKDVVRSANGHPVEALVFVRADGGAVRIVMTVAEGSGDVVEYRPATFDGMLLPTRDGGQVAAFLIENGKPRMNRFYANWTGNGAGIADYNRRVLEWGRAEGRIVGEPPNWVNPATGEVQAPYRPEAPRFSKYDIAAALYLGYTIWIPDHDGRRRAKAERGYQMQLAELHHVERDAVIEARRS